MCWANNLAGKQREPCIFHVIGAGKPDPLHNCSIVNRTNDSLEVECTEGFDGGQPQNFLLEVSGFYIDKRNITSYGQNFKNLRN